MTRALASMTAILMVGTAAAELPPVRFEKFATGFDSPLHLVPYSSGHQAFLVVDQPGVIHHLGAEGGEPGRVFLDVRPRMVTLRERYDERGLLGLALHPEFEKNGRLFVYYSAPLQDGGPGDYDHTAHLAEYQMLPDRSAADPSFERILLKVDQPQWNHNGGHLVFGPDGHLYVGLGDGGAAHDRGIGHPEEGNGQAMDRHLGKILRLDVSSGSGYAIPQDNPFVGKAGRDEIYALGLRNPWGMTFDGKGALLVADVGQNRYEEVNVVTKGGNYGWPRYEGFVPFTATGAGEVPEVARPAMPDGLIAPILAYPHNPTYGEAPAYGLSVTGGHLYRGKALPGLQGVYLFADYAMSWGGDRYGLFGGVREEDGSWTMHVLPGEKAPGGKDQKVVGFGQDAQGESYVLTNADSGPMEGAGAIWKIVPEQ